MQFYSETVLEETLSGEFIHRHPATIAGHTILEVCRLYTAIIMHKAKSKLCFSLSELKLIHTSTTVPGVADFDQL